VSVRATKVKWYGDKAKSAANRGAVRGLTEWANEVYRGSQSEVPVAVGRPDAGYLKATGKVDIDAGALRAAVSYDKSPRVAHLAIWVHERLDQAHPVGKTKYLEDPLNRSKDSGTRKLADAIKREIR
jgi:hypothetical protein